MGKHDSYLKYQVMTAEEVAAKMGVSPSGVNFLTKRAIAKLRKSNILLLNWLESNNERKTQNIGIENI